MQRLVKFSTCHSRNELPEWSTCRTKFEVLPVVVEDSEATAERLTALAHEYSISLASGPSTEKSDNYDSRRYLTMAARIDQESNREASYLGFVNVPQCSVLRVHSGPNSLPLTYDQAMDLVNSQECGISSVGEHVNGDYILVKSGWDFYQALKLLGYDHEQFLKVLKCQDFGFCDDTDSCTQCYKFNSRDDGYNSNFQYIESIGENLGIDCGCYAEYAESPESLQALENNSDTALELDVAEAHADAGRLKFITRYIGGMVDGRGGSCNGKFVKEGDPAAILKAFLKRYPNGRYVFSRDESGQFQTYFSVWRVRDRGF